MINKKTLSCPVCLQNASFAFFAPAINENIFVCGHQNCEHRFIENYQTTSGLRDEEDSLDDIRLKYEARIETYRYRNLALFASIQENLFDTKGTIVDFGSGDGSYLEHLNHIFGLDKVIAIEGKSEFANFIQGNGFKVVDQISDLPDKSVSLFLLNEVIEHLPDPLAILKEIHSKLTDNGSLFIATPLGADMNGVACAYAYMVQGHLHFFSQNSLNITLAEAGFYPLRRARITNPLYKDAPSTTSGINLIRTKIVNFAKQAAAQKCEVYPPQHISGLTKKLLAKR